MLVSIPVYTLPPLPTPAAAISPTFLTYTNGLNGWHHDVEAVLQRNWKAIEAGFNRFTSQGVVFGSSIGFLTQSTKLVFDSTQGFLGIGVAAPSRALHVVGAGIVTGTFESSATTVATLQAGNTTIAGTLGSSATTVATLQVVGNATVAGALVVAGALASSNSTVLGTLQVNGNTTLAGTLASSATTVATLHVTGNTTLAGSLLSSNTTVGGTLSVVGNTTILGTLAANSTAIGVFGSAPTTLAPAYTAAAFTTLRVFGSTVSTGGGATTLSSHFNQLLGVVACMAKDLGVGGAGYGWLR